MDRTFRTDHPRVPPGAAAAPPAAPDDTLTRLERHLHHVPRSVARRTMMRWRATCPALHAAGLARPSQVRAWLGQMPPPATDGILAHLVRHAQGGDDAAVLVVLACLGPGIRALAHRTGSTVDEIVSEVTVRLLDFPVDRRTSIAGGLLLDARNRLHRAAQRASRTQPLDDTAHPEAPGELGDPTSPTRGAVRLVCQAHRDGLIDHTDTQLILHTRIAGHPVKPVADHLGLSPSAAYQRRQRAETRLLALVA